MGDVVGFRSRKLTGFIPDEIGKEQREYREQQSRARDLVLFAKRGGPPLQPDDCA